MTVADCWRSRPAHLFGQSGDDPSSDRALRISDPGGPCGLVRHRARRAAGAGSARGLSSRKPCQQHLVRITRRYIADQRSIFNDPERRARLVSILGLFSDVGWPDALKLMYELPDLLRERRAMSWPADER